VTKTPADYYQLLGDIKQRIRSALYWDMGRLIRDRQQITDWGKSIITSIPATKNCHQWLQKLAGLKTTLFCESAKTPTCRTLSPAFSAWAKFVAPTTRRQSQLDLAASVLECVFVDRLSPLKLVDAVDQRSSV
jgi:hypothetical protein